MFGQAWDDKHKVCIFQITVGKSPLASFAKS